MAEGGRRESWGQRDEKAAILLALKIEREARRQGTLQQEPGSLWKIEKDKEIDSFLGLLEGTQLSPPFDLSSSETHVYLNFQPSELQVIKLYCFAPQSVVICFSSSRKLVQHMETKLPCKEVLTFTGQATKSQRALSPPLALIPA